MSLPTPCLQRRQLIYITYTKNQHATGHKQKSQQGLDGNPMGDGGGGGGFWY